MARLAFGIVARVNGTPVNLVSVLSQQTHYPHEQLDEPHAWVQVDALSSQPDVPAFTLQ
jgi:hypothetical protein